MAEIESKMDTREFHDVATEVLFENDRVRIWNMVLPPGGETGLHKHELDYIQIEIEGDLIAGAPEADAGGTYQEYTEIEVEPGRHFYVERGGVENAKNIGKKNYRGILIELKD
jgi:beta-alanine degradation protein BauB